MSKENKKKLLLKFNKKKLLKRLQYFKLGCVS